MSRLAGYDSHGNCVFAIPFSHEFLNRDECIEVLSNVIQKCLNKSSERYEGHVSNREEAYKRLLIAGKNYENNPSEETKREYEDAQYSYNYWDCLKERTTHHLEVIKWYADEARIKVLYDDSTTYGYIQDGVSIALIRDTKNEGWNHRIEFCEYKEYDNSYYPIISAPIDEKHEPNHKYDQKMCNKGGDECTMYSFVCGSDVYEII